MPNTKRKNTLSVLVSLTLLFVFMATPIIQVYAAADTCGSSPGVDVSIDIGCDGKGNPIVDMLFAVIRFLSIGVGLVIIASLIVAGIQYLSSRGDPQATAAAMKRIANTAGALLLFIFIFAIVNWLVPGMVLK